MKRFKQYLEEKKKPKGLKIQSLEDFLDSEGMLDEAGLIGVLDEVDLPQDVKLIPIDKKGLDKKFNKSLAGITNQQYDKFNFPAKSVQRITFVNDNGIEYDYDKLVKILTTPPTKLLAQNEKMSNTADGDLVFYNIGIPAMRGVLFDESDKKFKIAVTCPNAGPCQLTCFGLKGNFIRLADVSLSQTARLNFLINRPKDFEMRLSKDLKKKYKDAVKQNAELRIRWHDTGDFFSLAYVDMAFKIAKKFPEIRFYAYTTNAEIVNSPKKPDNFLIRFSLGARDSQTAEIDVDINYNARIIPKKDFKDYIKWKGSNPEVDENERMLYKSKRHILGLKKHLAKKYNRDPKKILIYDELMKIRETNVMQWSVIVALKGDGDDAGARRDVRDTLLMVH